MPASDAKKSSAPPSLDVLVQRLAATEGKDSRTLDASRAAAAQALGAMGDHAAVPALIQALSHPNQVSVAAALALGRLGAREAVEPLTAVLADDTKFWMPRGAAAVALGHMGTLAESALPTLTRALEIDVLSSGTGWDVRAHEAVADAIHHIKDPSAECTLRGKGQRYEVWGI
jgi:HEAT repeat protein